MWFCTKGVRTVLIMEIKDEERLFFFLKMNTVLFSSRLSTEQEKIQLHLKLGIWHVRTTLKAEINFCCMLLWIVEVQFDAFTQNVNKFSFFWVAWLTAYSMWVFLSYKSSKELVKATFFSKKYRMLWVKMTMCSGKKI